MADYNHHFWPSPRAVNFARYLIKINAIPPQKNLNHNLALQLIARACNCNVDTILITNPVQIASRYFPSDYMNMMKLLPHNIRSDLVNLYHEKIRNDMRVMKSLNQMMMSNRRM